MKNNEYNPWEDEEWRKYWGLEDDDSFDSDYMNEGEE